MDDAHRSEEAPDIVLRRDAVAPPLSNGNDLSGITESAATQHVNNRRENHMSAEVNPTEINKFEEHLQEFKERYSAESALINQSLLPTIERLENMLRKGGVKYQIASRMKDEDSAIQALRRRQKARMKRAKLKEEMEQLGQSWEGYWRMNRNLDRIDDHGPFPDTNAMFRGLHDIGGIRIMVYFPTDVKRVVEHLRELEGMECVRVVQRGQSIAPDMFMLDTHIAHLRKSESLRSANQTNNTFLGYRATHVHMKPSPTAKFVIEVQIQTVVMNAWSQIEHDIVYKRENEDTGDREREEKELILDTINGIVMVGENALRQLGEALERKKIQEQESSEEHAKHIYDVGKWITDHCEVVKGRSPLQHHTQSWNYLDLLYEYLKTGNEHTRGTIERLVTKVLDEDVDDKMFSRNLPLFMMRQKCSGHPDKIPARPDTGHIHSQNISRHIARVSALRVVHCLNVAVFLGVDEYLIRIMDRDILPPEEERPNLLDFLDILHPDHSRVDYRSMDLLCQFCDAFLDTSKFCAAVESHIKDGSTAIALIELPLRIAETGRIAYPIFSERSDESIGDVHPPDTGVVIPRTLCALLKDHENIHWIPEIYSAVKDWKDINQSPNRMFEIKQIRTNQTSSVSRPVCLNARASETIDLVMKQPDEKEETILIRNFIVKRPLTRWILNSHLQDAEFDVEFRVDLKVAQPRQHLGYFRSVRGSDDEVPKWIYFLGIPENWEWRSHSSCSLRNDASTKGFIRTTNSFNDFTQALLPRDASITSMDDADLHYSITLEQTEFILRLTDTELVLSKASQKEREGSPGADSGSH